VAEETLTLLMRAHGSRTVAREVDRVGRSVRGVGDVFGIGTNKVGIFERGIKLLGTRMGAIIVVAGALTATLGPPLLVVLTLLSAALITLAGMAIPIFALVTGAMARFKKQSDLAGSAANALKTRFAAISATFERIVAPGADILMWNLANALRVLQPVLATMRRPLTLFAQYLGMAMQEAAIGVAALGPEFRQMLISAAPLLMSLGRLVAPFLGMLIDVATAGIPVLAKLLDWLTDFIIWLRPAIQDLIRFESSAKAFEIAQTFMKAVAAAGVYLGSVLSALWQIVEEVFYAFRDWHGILQTIDVILVGFLEGLWVLVHLFQALPEPVRHALVVLGLLSLALAMFGPGMAVFGLITLIGLLTTAYNRSEALRSKIVELQGAMKNTWAIARNSPLFWLQSVLILVVGQIIRLAEKIGLLNIAWSAFKWVLGAVWWVLSKVLDGLKWIVNNGQQIGKVLDQISPGGETGLLSKQGLLGLKGIPIGGTGGTITRGGAAIVGERGAELVRLPTGSTIDPLIGGGDGPIWIAATFVTPSGEVLAQQTLRASKKRKASR
jgi:hypothetical protein